MKTKTLPNLVRMYLQELETTGRSSNTVKNYKADLSAFFNALDCQIEKATPSDIREYFLSIGSLSPASKSRKQACLSSFYRWCVKNDVIARNPMEVIAKVKVPKKLPRPIESSTLQKVLDSIPDKSVRDKTLITMLRDTGMRVSEAIALDLDDINLTNGDESIFVRESKGGKEREILIHSRPELISILKKHINKGRIANGPIFRNYLGERMTVRTAIDIWHKWLDVAGLNKGKNTLHTLRHYRITEDISNGVPLDIVSEQAGHSHIGTTMRYNEINRRRKKDAYLR